MNKIFLKTSLEKNLSNFSYLFLFDINFENLVIRLHVLYVLIMNIKFHSNWILLIIQSTNLFR